MNNETKIKWVIGIILVCLVIFGGMLVILQKYKYSKYYFDFNGYAVHRIPKITGDTYSIQVFVNNNPQPYLINSRYDPRELSKIEIENGVKNKILSKKELFITMDSKASAVSVLAATEISKITGNAYLYNIPTHGALNAPVEGKNITIKTCEDAGMEIGIIYLKKGSNNKIYSNGECVILESTDENGLVKVADRLMLGVLGVFNK